MLWKVLQVILILLASSAFVMLCYDDLDYQHITMVMQNLGYLLPNCLL